MEPTAGSGRAEASDSLPPVASLSAPPSARGSGRRLQLLVWLRRVSQGCFLSLFLWLLVETAFRGSFHSSGAEPVRLSWPVEAFFWFDPYVALLTLLSTHTVYWGLAWSLATLLVTLVFGRVFCGWVCPLGTLQQLVAWLGANRRRRSREREQRNRFRSWQKTKYYLLAALLGGAVAFGPLEGSALGGLFDPLSLAVRGLGLGAFAVLQYWAARLADALQASGVPSLRHAADTFQDLLAYHLFGSQQAHYHQVWWIVFLTLGLLAASIYLPRFWCRALCPLGALLGTVSRFSLFGMEKHHARCTDCNLCLRHCQGADNPQGGVKHRQEECHLCLNCQRICPEAVIRFRFLPDRSSSTSRPDLERRAVIGSVAAGVVSVPALRVANWPDRGYHPRVIRPPGAVEEREFLARCIRCGECMKVCPNNALHPALMEAGPEGLGTPILIPRFGYCELGCVLCGQVCPTGAIRKISEQARTGPHPIKLGVAAIDRGRCLPWGMSIPCIVCEEFCPTSPKAIWVESVEVPKRSSRPGPAGSPPAMETVALKRPYVDPELCVGCGACEKACPVVDQPAIYVTSAGETRSKTNVILLGR